MNEMELREAFVRKRLQRLLTAKHQIFHEFALGNGSARIDTLVISSILHGYELKSDRDSLERLPDQARIYSAMLDKVTLVTSYHHALEAIEIIPPWWGVTLAHEGQRGAVHFGAARSPRQNPNVNGKALVELLWRGEALNLLSELGSDKGMRSKPRERIYQRLADVAGVASVREAVIKQLRAR